MDYKKWQQNNFLSFLVILHTSFVRNHSLVPQMRQQFVSCSCAFNLLVCQRIKLLQILSMMSIKEEQKQHGGVYFLKVRQMTDRCNNVLKN
jgi:hypothetical protein